MLSLFTTVALTAFSSQYLFKTASATPCVAFDSDFNLYAFGLGGKDFSLGTQDTWASGTATDITASGRPPFDGSNTSCYLSQFNNAIYVFNGDKSNPTNVAFYDVKGKSWSIQKSGLGSDNKGGTFDYSNFAAILDHDTNVFYALSGSSNFYNLDFGNLKADAGSDTINWNFVGNPSFSTSGYNPVMALAENHIHFLDVPGGQAGTAQIFVIHFSFFQPAAQSYPVSGGGSNFPNAHGQVASFFQNQGVQQEFAFIPDDGSQTYVINVENNSTAVYTGPSDKSSSTFAAGITSLVQLTSAGDLFFFPYKQGDSSTNSAAKWTQIQSKGLPAPGSPSGSSSSSSGGSSPTGSKSGSASSPTGSGGSQNGGSSNGTGAAPGMYDANMLKTLGVIGLFTAIGCML